MTNQKVIGQQSNRTRRSSTE